MYVDLTGAGAATPVPFLSKFSQNTTVDRFDVTAFNDTNKVEVAGLPSAEGDFEGFYDTATSQLYTAAVDGLARKMYLYPDTTIPTTYFFGTANLDFSIDVDNSGPVTVSGTWSASSNWTKVGP